MSIREPRYTVRVSAELRRLRRGAPPGPERSSSDTAAAPPAPEPAVAGGAAPLAADGPAGRFGQRLRLRRDGRRPLVVEGVPLASFTAEAPLPPRDAETTGMAGEAIVAAEGPASVSSGTEGGEREAGLAEHTLAFFLTRDGRVVAQLRLLVPEQSPARPVHRVAELDSREDLCRFLDGYRPEEALWVGAPAPPSCGDGWRAAALKNLRAEFARLTAPLRDNFGECH